VNHGHLPADEVGPPHPWPGNPFGGNTPPPDVSMTDTASRRSRTGLTRLLEAMCAKTLPGRCSSIDLLNRQERAFLGIAAATAPPLPAFGSRGARRGGVLDVSIPALFAAQVGAEPGRPSGPWSIRDFGALTYPQLRSGRQSIGRHWNRRSSGVGLTGVGVVGSATASRVQAITGDPCGCWKTGADLNCRSTPPYPAASIRFTGSTKPATGRPGLADGLADVEKVPCLGGACRLRLYHSRRG